MGKHVPVSNQHKMLARYAREKNKAEIEHARIQYDSNAHQQAKLQIHASSADQVVPSSSQLGVCAEKGKISTDARESLPPGWDELFQPKEATATSKTLDGPGVTKQPI